MHKAIATLVLHAVVPLSVAFCAQPSQSGSPSFLEEANALSDAVVVVLATSAEEMSADERFSSTAMSLVFRVRGDELPRTLTVRCDVETSRDFVGVSRIAPGMTFIAFLQKGADPAIWIVPDKYSLVRVSEDVDLAEGPIDDPVLFSIGLVRQSMLSDDDMLVRALLRALTRSCRASGEEIEKTVEILAGHESRSIRAMALGFLVCRGDTDQLDAVETTLMDPDLAEGDRVWLMSRLVEADVPPPVPMLNRLLGGSSSPHVQRLAAINLCDVADDSSIEAFVSGLSSVDPTTRERSALGISRILEDEQAEIQDDPELLSRARTMLIRNVADANPMVVESVLEALGRLTGYGIPVEVLALSENPEPNMASLGLSFRLRHGDTSVLSRAVGLVETDPALRSRERRLLEDAIRSAVHRDGGLPVEELNVLLESAESTSVRRSAAESAAARGDESSIDALVVCLDYDDWATVGHCVSGLHRITREGPGPDEYRANPTATVDAWKAWHDNR